jgi:hypothetical protein
MRIVRLARLARLARLMRMDWHPRKWVRALSPQNARPGSFSLLVLPLSLGHHLSSPPSSSSPKRSNSAALQDNVLGSTPPA